MGGNSRILGEKDEVSVQAELADLREYLTGDRLPAAAAAADSSFDPKKEKTYPTFSQEGLNGESIMTKPCPNCDVKSTKGTRVNNNICCKSCKTQWCWLCNEKNPEKKALPEHFRSGPCKGLQFQKANSRKEAREQQEKKEEWIRNHKFRYYGSNILKGILLAPVIIVAGVLVIAVGMVAVVASVFYYSFCPSSSSDSTSRRSGGGNSPPPDDPQL